MIRRTLLYALAAAALAPPAGATSPTLARFPNQVIQLTQAGDPPAYLTITDRPELRLTGDFSIEAWVKADPQQTESPYPIIFTKPAGNKLNGECSYGLIVERATGHVFFRVTTTTGTYQVVWNGNLLDGAWHHVSGSRAVSGGGLIYLAIDGVSVSGVVTTGATLYSDEPLVIGASKFTGYTGNALVGQIDEVRIWNVAHSSDTNGDRLAVFNAAPGLVAAWHFDQLYPDAGGYGYFLDSVKNLQAARNNAAYATAGSPPHARGWGLNVVGVMAQEVGTPQRAARGATRPAGQHDVVYRQLSPQRSEIQVVRTANVAVVEGALDFPVTTPILRMVARDTVVFCLKKVTGSSGDELKLFPVRISDPTRPRIFGDSLVVKANTRMLIDPMQPDLLVTAGSGGANELFVDFVDVSNPARPTLQFEALLGAIPTLGSLVDVAKRGAYLYLSFDDGSLRIYRYTAFILNGNLVRSLDPVGSVLNLGGRCALGIGGTKLYAASREGTFRTYDIASPVAPVPGAWFKNERMIGEEVQVSGDRVGVTGANGVHLITVSNPDNPIIIGTWCPDMPTEGDSRLSMGGDFLGLTSGLGGYTLLTPLSTLGVPQAPPVVENRLSLGPNPSRGAVWFELPRELGAEATIEIHDVTGRLVRRVSSLREGGGTRWTWDGRDGGGAAVRAGVYLARLVEPGRVRTARFTIVR